MFSSVQFTAAGILMPVGKSKATDFTRLHSGSRTSDLRPLSEFRFHRTYGINTQNWARNDMNYIPQFRQAIAHFAVMAAWSRGMILASGARGHWFDSGSGPLFLLVMCAFAFCGRAIQIRTVIAKQSNLLLYILSSSIAGDPIGGVCFVVLQDQ